MQLCGCCLARTPERMLTSRKGPSVQQLPYSWNQRAGTLETRSSTLTGGRALTGIAALRKAPASAASTGRHFWQLPASSEGGRSQADGPTTIPELADKMDQSLSGIKTALDETNKEVGGVKAAQVETNKRLGEIEGRLRKIEDTMNPSVWVVLDWVRKSVVFLCVIVGAIAAVVMARRGL
ncbi:hypothetical protein ABPG77_009988 [Micractinium sp. CCAP 211/92]